MSNTEMSTGDLLRSAARLIERATQRLDKSRTACKDCGHAEFANKDEAQVARQFEETPVKLRKAAAQVEGWLHRFERVESDDTDTVNAADAPQRR